jgi:putative transposase
MTVLAVRQKTMGLVADAVAQGARQAQACRAINLSERTLQRWQCRALQGDLRPQRRQLPRNALTAVERQRILAVANAAEFAHLSPSQIVPRLSDQGQYLASASSFHRVLKWANQLKRRGRERAPSPRSKPRALSATRPNELYSWDITYLPTPVRGVYFYLYLVMDIYSRKVVGWQVYEVESAELASEVLRDICQRENIAPHQVTLHSDNGSPMKGATMLATLQALGVTPSLSRAAVSNDNPYSEALFRTLKYRPSYTGEPFQTLLAARQWVGAFVQWYNHDHRHSGIRFVTPAQRHAGLDAALLSQRDALFKKARQAHPERWSGDTRNWEPVTIVHLNPAHNVTRKQQPQASNAPLERAA